ncbi:MAG: SIR2 family protein, partial [Thaumarchaeota archaeon]|nr:SIR2 family protein [Nitrososphaerota archaeon]
MIPDELLESFQRGDVILFVGAGLSIGAGLPGWVDLVKPLARSVNARLPKKVADINSVHLLDALQRYENVNGRHALITKFRNSLDTTTNPPTAVHEAIVRLGVHTIFTTNYDNLIERAYRNAGEKVHVVVEDASIPFVSAESTQVIKLCGDLERPSSLIITKVDFSTYF